jgi:TM2 domain-containing membrane protein YozV
MRKSVKAALFSALVFPGAGHFILGKRVRGLLFSAISIVCLFVIVSSAVEIAREISGEIVSGQIPLDSARLTDEVSQRLAAGDSRSVTLSTYLLAACWLAGIADSWWVGRAQDNRGDDISGR